MFTQPQIVHRVLSDWLKQESDMRFSRDNIVIKSGSGKLYTGTVLAMIAVGLATAAHDAGGTGNSTFGAITPAAGAEVGKYKVIFTSATKFDVEDPQGVTLGSGTVGSAFNKGDLAFTITAGATPHAVGDTATITVAAGSGQYVPMELAGTLGTQNAAGILCEFVDATLSDQRGAAIVRGDVKIAPSALIWPAGVTTNQKAVALSLLEAQGILQADEA